MRRLDFPQALRHVLRGARITKLEWNNPEIYVFLDGNLRMRKGEHVHDLIVSEGDMRGTDWVILAEATPSRPH